MAKFLYVLLVQLLLFAVGTATVATIALMWRRPKRWLWYAMVKVGVVVMNGILLWAVIPSPSREIPYSAQAVGYMAGLLLSGVGLIGVSSDIIRKTGSRGAFGDPKGVVGVLEVDEGQHSDPRERG